MANYKGKLPLHKSLRYLHPELAAMARGWDTSKFAPFSKYVGNWQCAKHASHVFPARVLDMLKNSNCRICSGHIVKPGFNDLATHNPQLASQAYGWDPATVSPFSNKTFVWQCPKHVDHIFKAALNNRQRGDGCPICSGRQLLVWFNDLKTTYPELAKQSYGWDPATVTYGNGKKLLWQCEKFANHIWLATPNARTCKNTGCPECSESGFNPGKQAWLYLMKSNLQQQIGITNKLEGRIKAHKTKDKTWEPIQVIGPCRGSEIQALEAQIKIALKRNLQIVPGTTENWYRRELEVETFEQLFTYLGLQSVCLPSLLYG